MSHAEIAAFCRTPQKARQIRFLQKNGIRHYIDSHGRPVVLWSAINGVTIEVSAVQKNWKSNKVA